MNRRRLPLLLLYLLLATLLATGQTTLASDRFYGGAGIAYTDLKISETHFHPTLAQMHIGGWVWKNIGLELRLNSELSDDSTSNVIASVPQIVTAALRFQSPEEWHLKAYFLFGVARVTLDTRRGDSGFPGKNDFDAAVASFGLLAPVSSDRRLAVLLEANRYFLDDENDMPLTVGVLGVQYDF